MNTVSEVLKTLARDSIYAAKARAKISRLFKKSGFIPLGKGGWLAFKNKDIVSGFAIEGSPTDTYVSTFLLPSFDKHRFISLSLGDRVAHFPYGSDVEKGYEEAINSYRATLPCVRSSNDLMDYLEKSRITGHYPIWARYICYLNVLELDKACKYLDEDMRGKLHATQIERYKEINRFVVAGDKSAVTDTLDSWRHYSERIFGSFRQNFIAL